MRRGTRGILSLTLWLTIEKSCFINICHNARKMRSPNKTFIYFSGNAMFLALCLGNVVYTPTNLSIISIFLSSATTCIAPCDPSFFRLIVSLRSLLVPASEQARFRRRQSVMLSNKTAILILHNLTSNVSQLGMPYYQNRGSLFPELMVPMLPILWIYC